MTEKDWLRLNLDLGREKVRDKDITRVSTPFQYKVRKTVETIFLEKAMQACQGEGNDSRPYTEKEISAIETELGKKLSWYEKSFLSGIAQRYFICKGMIDKKSSMFRTRKKELQGIKKACESILDKIDNPNPLFMSEFDFFKRLRADLERMHAVVSGCLQFGPTEQESKKGRPSETARHFFIQELKTCYETSTGREAKIPYRIRGDAQFNGPFFRFVNLCLCPLEEDGNRTQNTELGRAIQEAL
jgi:hypothetical protein